MPDGRVRTAHPVRRGHRSVVGLVALVVGISGTAACGAGLNAATTKGVSTIPGANATAGDIQILNLRVRVPRSGFVEPRSSAAMFAVFVNEGNRADRLVRATTPAARGVAIPLTDNPGAVPLPNGSLRLNPHRSTALEPETTFLRLDGMVGRYYSGQVIRVALQFAVNGIVAVDVPLVTDVFGA